MAVRYIFGRAGRGKSRYAFEEIKNCLQKDEEHQLILLVPEQFTLQSERDLIEKLGLPGIMRVEVLSITRLAHRIFNEVGGATRILLNEQGKNMVLRKVIDEAIPELTIYKKAAKQDGFVAKFSELLSDLKIYDVTPLELEAKLEEMEEGSIIRQKVRDIATIYQRFNGYLQGRYIDTEDYINLLIEKIDGSKFLRDAQVWIDGFTTFTPQTLRIIERIMTLARDTTIVITTDRDEAARDHDLFTLSQRAYMKIHAMAREKGLEEEIIDLNLDNPGTFTSPEIGHLEKELYAYPYHRFAGPVQNIDLSAGTNMMTEVENMTVQVLSLVRERGYRWKDIAVVCNDMESYGSLIKREFEENDIPFFLDKKRDIMNNPIVELILSSLEIVSRDYRYEDVFRFLKTGLSDLTADEVEILENYALRYGIQGNRWKTDFTLGDPEELERLNGYREKFIGPMEKFAKKMRGKKSFAEMTKALYQYMESISLGEKLSRWIDRLAEQHLYEAASENSQIWNIVMDIFDQMVEILGDQTAGVKEYARVLESGFLSYEIGIIPTTIDQVLVGEIQRSKSHDIKGLFVLGVNDGVLPSGKDQEGILSDEEKAFLQEKGLDLGADRETRSGEERFLIYSALTKPRQYLWLSYALADCEGKAMRPSILIDRFQKLFKGLAVRSDLLNDGQQFRMVSTPKSTFKHLVKNLRSHLDGEPMDETWWDVYGWYCGHKSWDETRRSVLEGFFHKNQVAYMGKDKAKLLYSMPVRSSVSRLEQFVNCPFAHFVRYGLRPQERKVFEVGAPDMGELFHSCLLSFAKRLAEQKINWQEIEREQCESIVENVMDELIPGHGHGVMSSTHRYKYLANRLKRISKRAVWVLTEHVKRGDFRPQEYEVSFGQGCRFPAIEIELEDGEKVFLEGRIDRLDLLDDEDAAYVKIIDYKSGDKEFSLSDAYYGLSMQLLIYLSAVLAGKGRLGKEKLKPAGIFYFKIDDPLVKSEEKVAEVVEEKIRKELKMKGLVLKDVKIVRRMDREIQGYSDVLPVALSKQDEFYQNSSALEENDLLALLRHVEGLVKEISREMLQGNIKIEPVKTEKQKACDYCSYRAICQFDSLFEDNRYKNIKRLKDEEVIAKITKDEEVKTDAQLD